MTHFLQRTSLIALAAGALGACSTYAAEPLKPNFPVRAEEAPSATTSPPAIQSSAAVPTVEEAPLAPVRTATAVESRPLATLAPPQAQPPAEPRPIVLAAAETSSRSTRRSAPAQPATRTVTSRSVTGKVVEVAGSAETYKVRKGDTLEKIAKKLDTTVAQLREDNDLKKREAIHPGDVLKGPQTKAKAYVVVSGDTLFAIARRFTLTADDLAQENKIGRSSALRAGQRLRLPDGYKDKGPIVTTSRVAADDSAAQDEPEAAPTPTRSSSRSNARSQPTRAETPDEADGGESPFTFQTSTRRTVTGRVITVEGPAAAYTVRKGDNLEKIADKLGTTVDQLREDNGLKKRATIHPGQKLKGPRSEAKAYVANGEDTLSAIAKRFNVTEAKLRAENGLSRRATVRSGQRIRLPDGYRDRGPVTETTRTPVARPAPSPTPVTPRPQPVEPTPPRVEEPAPRLPSSPQPYTGAATPPRTYTPPAQTQQPQTQQPQTQQPQTQPAPRVTPQPSTARPYTPPPTSSTPAPNTAPSNAPTSAGAVSDAQISELGRGRFVWPLQGDIVSDYGPKGGGQRNDGLNIGATLGAPVRAAAAGDVVYAGDQVPGFGNLVLIKHADGWVTAYAHLSRIDVKMQQRIAQGQQVGQAGATGGVPQPQLHFEVRFAPSPLERARPVDPKLVLPR